MSFFKLIELLFLLTLLFKAEISTEDIKSITPLVLDIIIKSVDKPKFNENNDNTLAGIDFSPSFII
jgi:hypothetical protein